MDRAGRQVIETCEEATRWLYERIDYERSRPDGGQRNPFRLDRTVRLLQLIGSPQLRIPCVHLAGTKGKGSTAAMVESILRESGVNTGLFTSPHIATVQERMRVCGQLPSPRAFTQLVDRLAGILHDDSTGTLEYVPTFFETTTLLAWMLFDQCGTDLVVLETGLGGRLDCTNVCRPLVTLITSIGLDHTHILGDTIPQIAAEKAGILKPGVPAILGRLAPEAEQVVCNSATERSCPVLAIEKQIRVERSAPKPADGRETFSVSTPHVTLSDLEIPLSGAHQVDNAALAVAAIGVLRESGYLQCDDHHIRTGLSKVSWPLRFEYFDRQPAVILDAAHNPDSARAFVATLNERFSSVRPRVLVFAVSADKDARAMLEALLPAFDVVVVTRFVGNPRSVSPEQLARLIQECGWSASQIHLTSGPDQGLAVARGLAGPGGLVCVTGSLFLAAEARALLTPQGALLFGADTAPVHEAEPVPTTTSSAQRCH